jgi:heme exporter protein A
MLEVTNLACARGEQQLFSNLCFKLREGELLQVQGENGSGKTTLLRALCGFVQPLAGKILWHGNSIYDLDEEYHADIIYLGHQNAVKDDLSSLENLRISCALSDYEVNNSAALEALRHMGLRGRETFPVKVLSQGQRRRVALARLLLSKAPLWILDEPLAALDTEAAGLIQDMIGRHLKSRGMVIYTTHQTLEVAGTEVQRLSLS